jgi:hypothetical protein
MIEIYGPVKEPLLPVRLLKNVPYMATIIVGVVAQMGFYALNIFIPRIAAALFFTDNIKIGLISVCTLPKH